ncbi:unnamed protein product [Sphenostylis stenocarpa]|uniref:Uncharacterized protein n=1 Tax=Sphenostylis stenocarpa TaxID=92480 RepID=A0AA86T053_9FABA|nr:unnamed protein product [Sphenostylis stenocarpa]
MDSVGTLIANVSTACIMAALASVKSALGERSKQLPKMKEPRVLPKVCKEKIRNIIGQHYSKPKATQPEMVVIE